MVIVLTSNGMGGIAQFADALIGSLNDAGVSSLEFVPYDSGSQSEFARRLPRVSQTDALTGGEVLKDCASTIASYEPEAVIVADTALVTLVIALRLRKNFPIYTVIHDAKPHPSGNRSFKAKVLNLVCKKLSERLFRRSRGLVFLSENTRGEFEDEYGKTKRGISLKLCAHPVSCTPVRPSDFPETIESFVLFFGRIDKYKGLGRLLDVYSGLSSGLPSLVIAGSGELSDAEFESLGRCESVTLINRFISDAEMVWLFANCEATVLPYIEASQSGVLAMSYHFGKPVVVSDLPGLTEFVDDGSTGYVFHDEAELAECLRKVSRGYICSDRVLDYVKENLSWEVNTATLLSGMGISRRVDGEIAVAPVLSEAPYE